MEVRILGPLEAWCAGAPVSLAGTKQRAVLAMLVLHANQVVPVHALVDGVWGQKASDGATNAVQVYISRLRKALDRADGGEVAILRRGPGYVIEIEPEHIDLRRFERLVAEGTETLPDDPTVAAAKLREALGLWRGPPLAEFANEPFAQTEVPRLEDQRLIALIARVEADLALGRHAALVGELEGLVKRYPFHEGLHRLLILALYRCGRQAEALHAYRRIRRTLAEELGIDPNRTLLNLEAAVLAQDPRLDWYPASATDPPATLIDPQLVLQVPTDPGSGQIRAGLPHVWNLPPRNPHFTGRDALLKELHERLCSGDEILVVQALHGLGGVGKTQLAIEYGYRFAEDYDLVWWVDAENPMLIPDQLTRLAARLNLPSGPTAADTVGRLLAELRSRGRWLLILDNAQRADEVAEYCPRGIGHVLITSRSRGWGALGTALEIDVPPRVETMALLRARVPALSEQLADELAAELGDLPLAAAQAAAYMEQTALPPTDYLRRFRSRRLDLLSRGDVLGYRGRIDTAWALSLDRLRSEDSAAVQLLELAAFLAPEPIPLTLFTDRAELLDQPLRTIAADPDALADAVGALVGYSLARRAPDSFQVHRLVQAVIRHQLRPARRQAASDQTLALLTAAQPSDFTDSAQWDTFARLAPHVLATNCHAGDQPASRGLLLALINYLTVRGDNQTSRAIAEDLLQRWRHQLGSNEVDTLTLAAYLASVMARLGDTGQARMLGEDTLSRCRRILGEDHPTTLGAATTLIYALAWLGDTDQARMLGEDTLSRCRRILGEDHPTTLGAATTLIYALAWLGDTDQARMLGEDTLSRCRRILGEDHTTTLRAATNLTYALAWLGDTDQARMLGEDTLSRCRRILGEDHTTTLRAATNLTYALAWLGDTNQARVLGEDTLSRCRRILGEDHPTTLLVLANLTYTLASSGYTNQARALNEDALDRCQEVFGTEHPITLIASAGIALTQLKREANEQAHTSTRRTLTRCQRVLGPDHPVTLTLIQALD